MKAVRIRTYGGPEMLEVQTEIPTPSPGDHQVLVKIHAVTINPFDIALLHGMYKDMIPLTFPVTVGGDFAGVIQTASHTGVYKPGDAIFGTAITVSGGSGAYAEFAVASEKNISRKPKTLDFIQAAGLPLVGSSAVQALEEHIRLQKNQKILIHGGAGGIGHIAIQLAKSKNAYVASTARSDDLDFLKSLGADEVIDYENQKFETLIEGFDAVLDLVGAEVTTKSFAVLKQGGILVSLKGQPDANMTRKYNVTTVGQNTKTDTNHLSRVAELAEGGIIKVHLDKVFSLETVREAFIYKEQHHPRGKIVIQVN